MPNCEKNIEKLLSECEIFSQLPQESITLLGKTASIRRFNDKEILFSSSQKADGFYAIISGRVEVFRSSENGRKQVLHIIEEGETLGEVPLFEGGCYPASAASITEVEAIYIHGDKFMAASLNNPEILLEMLAVLSRRLRKFVNLIDDLSLKDVSQRLSQYLKERTDNNGITTIDCTKAELANRLGTIPETLSRALNKLKTEKKVVITNSLHI